MLNFSIELENKLLDSDFEQFTLRKFKEFFNFKKGYLAKFEPELTTVEITWIEDEGIFYKECNVQEANSFLELNLPVIERKRKIDEQYSKNSKRVYLLDLKNYLYIIQFKFEKIPIPDDEILKAILVFDMALRARNSIQKVCELYSERYFEKMEVTFHELRNYLSSINTGVDLLIDRDIDDKDRASLYASVKKTFEDITNLIKNIDTLLKIERKVKINLNENVNLNEIVQELVMETTPLRVFNNITIDVNLPENAKISGNPDWIKIALRNLIVNAIKYNKPNGYVYIKGIRKRRSFSISIEDTGKGLPENVQKELGKKYLRGSHTRVTGTGLGLYIVKNVVLAHNGKLKFKTKQGKGTIFEIEIPKVPYRTFIFSKTFLALFSFLILVSSLLYFVPIFPTKPEYLSINGMNILRLKDKSVLRIDSSQYEYSCRKNILGNRNSFSLNLKDGEANLDTFRTKVRIKTPFTELENKGTSFDVSQYPSKTCLSVFDGKVKTGDSEVENGKGAIINKDSKVVSLLPSVSNLAYFNRDDGLLKVEWDPVSGAKNYLIYLSEDEEFFKIVKKISIGGNNLIINLQRDGTYYLRIYAVDENGLKGMPSQKMIKNFYHLKKGILLRNNGDFKASIEQFEKSCEEFEKREALPISEMAWTYYIMGDFERAELKYKEALEIQRSHKDLNRLARVYFLKSNLKDAEKIYSEVLNENPKNSDALWGIAEIFLKKGEIKKSENILRKLERINNKYPLLYCSFAKIAIRKGDINTAKKFLSIELRNNPNSKEAKEILKEIEGGE